MSTNRTVEYSAMSAVGLRRIKNEDNLYAQGLVKPTFSNEPFKEDGKSTEKLSLFVVCDGMGGESSGEIASSTTVNELDSFVERLSKHRILSHKAIYNEVQTFVQFANKKICDHMTIENISRMGTTITGALIVENTVVPFGMGDSRTYLFSVDGLIQLTQDHTQAQRLLDLGMITEEEMMSHPGRNKLIYHLGVPEDEGLVQAEVFNNVNLSNNDRLLLCSDGLTEHLTNTEIENIMGSYKDTHECADELMRLTYERGATDNVSCIVVNIYIKNNVKSLANKIEGFLKRGSQ